MISAPAVLLPAVSGQEQRGDGAGQEQHQRRERHEVPAHLDGRLVGPAGLDRAGLLQRRPAAADHLGGRAGLGGEQVAGAAQAVLDARPADPSAPTTARARTDAPSVRFSVTGPVGEGWSTVLTAAPVRSTAPASTAAFVRARSNSARFTSASRSPALSRRVRALAPSWVKVIASPSSR